MDEREMEYRATELAFEQRSPFAWVARVGEYHLDRYLIMKTRGDWRLTYPGYQFHNVTAPTREQCEEAAREHYARYRDHAEFPLAIGGRPRINL